MLARKAIAACSLVLSMTFSGNAATAAPPELLYGEQLGCLAMNIYQEARGEADEGKLAVGAVTMNRVKSKHYPNSICEVVWQPKQFSWTSLKVKYHVPKDLDAWVEALEMAELFMQGEVQTEVGDATHYHATSVSPDWMDKNQLIAQLGNHLFYSL